MEDIDRHDVDRRVEHPAGHRFPPDIRRARRLDRHHQFGSGPACADHRTIRRGHGYFAAKFGVVGLMKAYAGALGEYNIRVNSIHPCGVDTPMVVNDFFPNWIAAHPKTASLLVNALPTELVEPADVSNAVLFLVSDTGRYVTGLTMTVDAGLTTVH